MTLAGVRVRHPWVDSNNRMRIMGYPPIQSEKVWKESNIMLGDAVHAVVKHLQLNPPEILEITDKGLQNIQSNTKKQQFQNGGKIKTPPRNGTASMNGSRGGSSADDAPPSYNIVAEATPAPEVPMPTIPGKYQQVEGLSRPELDDLMDDELEFVAFVHKLSVYDELYSIGSKRLNENVKLAKENLEKEPKLVELQADIKRLQTTIKAKHEVFSKLEAKQNAICAPPDKAETLRNLYKAKKEAFDQSEELAEAWVEDGGNVDDFCKKFLETRKVHHMRAAKMEILKNSRDVQEI
jgi:ESCRT-I complex subunit VPS37